MRIILINQAFYPDTVATAQHVTDLALYLSHHGCDVSVLCDGRDYSDRKKPLPKHHYYHGIEIFRVWSTGLGRKNIFYRLFDAISFNLAMVVKLFTVKRPEVIVAFTSPPFVAFLAAVYAYLMRIRLLYWVMDLYPDVAVAAGVLKPNSLLTKLFLSLQRFTIRQSSEVIVLDEWMKSKLSKDRGTSTKATVVPIWPVHVPEKDSELQGQVFRQTFGLENKFVVLYSGNHALSHPLDTLLEAAVQLKQDPNTKFLFIGSGVRTREVSLWVEKHHLYHVVQLPHQPREKLNASLMAADLHVVVMGNKMVGLIHPSKLYGSLLTGKPTVFIGPRNGPIDAVLKYCPHVYQVEHGQLKGLLEIFRQVKALDSTQKASLSEASKEFVKKFHDPEHSMGIFLREILLKTPSQKPDPKSWIMMPTSSDLRMEGNQA